MINNINRDITLGLAEKHNGLKMIIESKFC